MKLNACDMWLSAVQWPSGMSESCSKGKKSNYKLNPRLVSPASSRSLCDSGCDCHCGIVTIVTLLDTIITSKWQTLPSSLVLVTLLASCYPLLADKIPDGLSAKCEVNSCQGNLDSLISWYQHTWLCVIPNPFIKSHTLTFFFQFYYLAWDLEKSRGYS